MVEEVFNSLDQFRSEIAILIIEYDLDLVQALADCGHGSHTAPAVPLQSDIELCKQVLWM